jgi:hypothetical protein
MASSTPSLRFVAILTAFAIVVTLARPAFAAQPVESVDPAPPSPPPPPPADPEVRLIVQSDKPGTRIQKLAATLDVTWGYRNTEGQLWTDLCVAPCERTVAAGDQLRAGGLGIALSDPFLVPPGKDVAMVSVKTAPQDVRNAGVAFTSIGTLAVLTGVGMLIGAATMEPPTSGPFADPAFAGVNAERANTAGTLRTIGIVSLVAGGISLLVGISTLSRNRTEVMVH